MQWLADTEILYKSDPLKSHYFDREKVKIQRGHSVRRLNLVF
jgi:hypothetical protein